jgi:hypothetical protein
LNQKTFVRSARSICRGHHHRRISIPRQAYLKLPDKKTSDCHDRSTRPEEQLKFPAPDSCLSPNSMRRKVRLAGVSPAIWIWLSWLVQISQHLQEGGEVTRERSKFVSEVGEGSESARGSGFFSRISSFKDDERGSSEARPVDCRTVDTDWSQSEFCSVSDAISSSPVPLEAIDEQPSGPQDLAPRSTTTTPPSGALFHFAGSG